MCVNVRSKILHMDTTFTLQPGYIQGTCKIYNENQQTFKCLNIKYHNSSAKKL